MRTFFAATFEPFGATRGVAAALRYAEDLGYPVFVKPNEGTRAYGATRAETPDQLGWALEHCFQRREGRVTLVQECLDGPEVRLIVVEDEVKLAYRKDPLWLEGDGETRVGDLIDALQARRAAIGRKPIKLGDARLRSALERQGLDLDSRPLGRLRLSDGLTLEFSEAVTVLDEIPADWQRIGREALATIGLRFGSVDAILRDGCEDGLTIIELNSAPGLIAFSTLGEEARAVDVYEAVLRSWFGL